MRKTIVEYLANHAKSYAEKIAVIANGAETSYGELWQLVRGYSRYLKESGMHKGDIVVTHANQTLAYVVQYFGIHLAQGVVASLEKNIPPQAVVSVAEQLDTRLVIADDITALDGRIVLPKGDVVATARAWYDESVSLDFPVLEDSADILFTTGTTGDAKGVELSHKALVATAENLIAGCAYKSDTVLIVPGPLNHANAIRKLFTTITNGSAIYLLNGMMSLAKFFAAVQYPRGNIACCLPPAAIRTIFQMSGEKIADFADRIDFIESATAPLPEPDKERLCALLPKTRLYNNYGSSESASVCIYDYNAYPQKKNCVGRPMPNAKIFVVDDDNRKIASSKDCLGRIACAGDMNMKGYVNAPLETAEVLSDGIVYTNDIGYIGEDGFVYVIGRKGDVINVGGLKVAPTEVESAALRYDGIEDCICIPVPDEITGNALKLLVVLRRDCLFEPRKIASHLKAHLEQYKVPRLYEQVEKVERTYNGKLNRKAYAGK